MKAVASIGAARGVQRLGVRDLQVGYGNIRAVQGASLAITTGITALVGANGAGKSSLVKAIAGLVPVRGGEVTLPDGRSILRIPSHRRVRELGIVLVPEGRGVLPAMTVRENLEFGLRVGRRRRAEGTTTSDAAGRLEPLIELFPQLRDRLQSAARLLSGGEQQMLSLARSLASAPSILLIDEPSLGLSPSVVVSLFAAISDVARRDGIALLLIEQDTKAAIALSDYVYVMERGEILLHGPSADVAANPALRDAYLGSADTREEGRR
jgi:branched-chain amino acid transport system ATP-binding protein